MKYKTYICSVCGCRFAVNIEDVKYAEKNGIYLSCPIHGKHRNIKAYKDLMEEKRSVRM